MEGVAGKLCENSKEEEDWVKEQKKEFEKYQWCKV